MGGPLCLNCSPIGSGGGVPVCEEGGSGGRGGGGPDGGKGGGNGA